MITQEQTGPENTVDPCTYEGKSQNEVGKWPPLSYAVFSRKAEKPQKIQFEHWHLVETWHRFIDHRFMNLSDEAYVFQFQSRLRSPHIHWMGEQKCSQIYYLWGKMSSEEQLLFAERHVQLNGKHMRGKS